MSEELVAVTGATGFVGRRLVARLAADGVSVRELSRRELDLAQPGDLGQVLGGVTTVCHLAAYIPSDHGDSSHAAACMQVNALGTLALLEGCVASGVRRFVHFSSGNVYRHQPRPVTEDDPLYPSARAPYYLASKVCGEIFADHFGARLAVAIARISSVYGPGMVPRGMLPTFATRLRAGHPVTVQDGGRYRSDLVHVDDIVEGTVRLLASDVRGPINLGSGQAVSTLEAASTIAELLGRDASSVVVEPALSKTEPSGFAPLDIGRARRELDYTPRSFRDGIATYLASV